MRIREPLFWPSLASTTNSTFNYGRDIVDCATDLIADVIKLASSGHFSPSLPITIDVPKKQRIRPSGVKRLPPNFVRPGGILLPRDRLLMQAIADVAQPITEQKLNRKICFSHQPADAGFKQRMFKPSRACWSEMQAQISVKWNPFSRQQFKLRVVMEDETR